MTEPRCIRYFNDEKLALSAKKLLVSEGFEAEVKEIKIGSVTIDKNGYPLKFKLFVERVDINRIAQILAKKLKG